MPVVMYNGMPFQREQLDPDELETVTMHKILETTTFFQRAVYLVHTHARSHTRTHAHAYFTLTLIPAVPWLACRGSWPPTTTWWTS